MIPSLKARIQLLKINWGVIKKNIKRMIYEKYCKKEVCPKCGNKIILGKNIKYSNNIIVAIYCHHCLFEYYYYDNYIHDLNELKKNNIN